MKISVTLRVVAAMLSAHAVAASARATPPLDTPFLMVSEYSTGLWRVNPVTGAVIDRLATLPWAGEMAVGPDGAVYVCQFEARQIRKYDPQTGALLQTYLLPGKPRGITFGPDGLLYIGDTGSNGGGVNAQVRRLDPVSGQVTSLVTSFPRPFDSPIGLSFGPDSMLYVALAFDSVDRYDPQTGARLGTFCEQGIDRPQSVLFRSDGRLLVTNQNPRNITQYDAQGAYLGVFASELGNPQGMLFLPDGSLLAARFQGSMWRLHGDTGAFLGQFAQFGNHMVMIPEPVAQLALFGLLLLLRRCRPRAVTAIAQAR